MSFADIEQALKDICKDEFDAGRWPWLATAASYGGEFDDDLLDIVKRFPAIWVTVSGDQAPQKLSYNKYKYFVKVMIVVGASSMRNEEARRHGAGSDIGAYDMLQSVWARFTESTLSEKLTGLNPLELGKTKTIFNTMVKSKSISVIAQEYTTSFIIRASDRDREENAADYIHRIHADYYFKPSDNVPDEADLVELKDKT